MRIYCEIPEIQSVRVTRCASGVRRATKIARRGRVTAGLGPQGNVILITPEVSRNFRFSANSRSWWVDDLVRCMVDLGIIDQDHYDRYRREITLVRKAEDARESAAYVAEQLEELGVKTPAKLARMAEGAKRATRRRRRR